MRRHPKPSMEQDLRQIMVEHMDQDSRLFSRLDDALESIKDNHLAHIQKSVAEMETNIGWLRCGIIATYFKP